MFFTEKTTIFISYHNKNDAIAYDMISRISNNKYPQTRAQEISRLRIFISRFLKSRLFRRNLEVVEALAIDADDGTLRDKGVRVDVIDDAEDKFTLAAFG